MKSMRLGVSGLYPSYDSVQTYDRPLSIIEEKPLSFRWRLLHATLCIFGAIAFFLGSTQYFPSRDHPTRGSALYTMGSAGYFFGDVADFWIYNDFNWKFFTKQDPGADLFAPSAINATFLQWFRAHEYSFNLLLTAMGSLCYFLGCVLFFPQLGHETLGDILFIPGSCIILLSEAWKMYRAGCTVTTEDETTFLDRDFSWSNVWRGDLVMFCGDLCAWLGAATFLVGTIYFLPEYDVDAYETRLAATLFVVGSVLFLFSAWCICIKYFYSGDYSRAEDLALYSSIVGGGVAVESMLHNANNEQGVSHV